MYIISNFVKNTVPNYLAGLPIPDSIGGWFHLGVRDWLALIPPTVVIGGITFCSYRTINKARTLARINGKIRLDERSVKDIIDIENVGDKTALCRCWGSRKFPLCDGSHNPHNILTGDNLGPAILRRVKPAVENK